jgi:phage-related protein
MLSSLFPDDILKNELMKDYDGNAGRIIFITKVDTMVYLLVILLDRYVK